MANQIVKDVVTGGIGTIANLIVPGSGAIVAKVASPVFDAISKLFKKNKASGKSDEDAAIAAQMALTAKELEEWNKIVEGEHQALLKSLTEEDKRVSTMFKKAKFDPVLMQNKDWRGITVRNAINEGLINPYLLNVFAGYAESKTSSKIPSRGSSSVSVSEPTVILPTIEVVDTAAKVVYYASAGNYYKYLSLILAAASLYFHEVMAPLSKKRALTARKRRSSLKKARAIKNATRKR